LSTKDTIINDPVYGFINVPKGILFHLVEHPFFQRLRRISQLGLTSLVYPGAHYSRFHHALGALHLMQWAIQVLRSKGVEISKEEAQGACIAILLHDIGHGPFSHTLENFIIKGINHESLTLKIMEYFNQQLDGQLTMAIEIFKGKYKKQFLHQLVSGQLDVDRMDYIIRDSYYAGVAEGKISVERIIKLLDVREGKIVVHEKGIYPVENFLIARRLMYWQVYLHKTVIAAEQMLVKIIDRARYLLHDKSLENISPNLEYFLAREWGSLSMIGKEEIERICMLDDIDIWSCIKTWQHSKDKVLSYLATNLLNRKLLKIKLGNKPLSDSSIDLPTPL